MHHLQLYSTEFCHLCEAAEAVITPFILPYNLSVEVIDISEDIELFNLYGTKIPVLKSLQSSRDLIWPFDAAELQLFLDREN